MRAAALLLLAATAGACASYAGVDLGEPLDEEKQRCVECALREHTDPESVAEAAARFGAACRGGDARSCSALGVMCEEGRGMDKDPHRAKSLYSFACRAGNARACVNLGSLYEEAVNGPKDLDGAIVMYDLACAGGMPEGCFHLGRARYVNGEVGDAVNALRRSCKQGFAEACEALGTMYRHGHGVKRDLKRARSFLMRGCKQGRSQACDRLDELRQARVANARNRAE